jgi:hypothetical protein
LSEYEYLFERGELCKCWHGKGDHFSDVFHLDGYGKQFKDRTVSKKCAMCRSCNIFRKADNLDLIEYLSKHKGLI